MKEFLSLDRLTRIAALAVAVFSATAGSVNASWLVVNDVIQVSTNDRWGGADGGGEFRIRETTASPGGVSSSVGPQFFTFCLERSEFINPGSNVGAQQYLVQSIQNSSIFNGQSLPSGEIFLNNQTKALFAEFHRIRNNNNNAPINNVGSGGTFGGTYTVGSGTVTLSQLSYSGNADANALQKAIWALHGNQWATDLASNSFYQWANSNLTAINALAVAGFYDAVKVVNITKGRNPGGEHAQSFLYWNASGSLIPVPEPTTATLFALGLVSCIGFVRSRPAIPR